MEQATNIQKNSGKVKSKEETPVPMSYQPPRILLTGIHHDWAMPSSPGRTLSQRDWPEQPETNPVTIKPGTVSHMAEQSSWIHFQGSDKSPTLWFWKRSPFLQYLHLSFLISVMGLWSSGHNQRTLASSLMGHRCPQHLPSSTGFMASH